MQNKLHTTLFALAMAGLTSTTSAAIVAFPAESGTLGTNWESVANGANTTTYPAAVSGALTGSVITPLTNDGGSGPGDAGQLVTYSVTLAADTYDIWARLYVNPAGNQSGANSTSQGTGEDSFYVGVDFGTFLPNASDSQTVNGGLSGDWATINNLSTDTAGNAGVANNTWTWVNLSDTYGSFANAEDVPTYTSAGATETFQIGNREMGLWIDAFAFVTSTENPTTAALDAAVVPEPSTYALLAGFLALGLVMLRRRQKV